MPRRGKKEAPAKPPTEPWESFADAVLQREALAFRLAQGAPPRDFAGLYIGDEEVDHLLFELPGLGKAREPSQVDEEIDIRIDELRKVFHASLLEPDSLFAALAWNARLLPEEAEVLAVLCAVELDPRRQRLTAYFQDNVTLPRLTLAGIRSLFPEPHIGPRAVAADSRLRRSCLASAEGDGPWAVMLVHLPRSVAWALLGDTSLDDALPLGARVMYDDTEGETSHGLVAVSGGDSMSRLLTAFRSLPGIAYLVSPVPANEQGWEALIREATAAGLAIVLELEAGVSNVPPEARHWMDRATHLSWAISSDAEVAVDTLPERPWRDERVVWAEADDADWQAALGTPRTGGHRLDREQLRLATRAYDAVGKSVEGAVRRIASGKLDSLAVRIRPRRTWDDLIVPQEQVDQLKDLTARYRQRLTVYESWNFHARPSAGVVALFSGPSGTGKTLTAEIMAGDLGLDAYKIDLSSVVSKYIGETEKNLESIFSAASAGNVVLFFDEADSLFGKRSEVSDAHDRYANIEVSYLLQRLERYDGFVILATNFQKNIDQAFLRRIHMSVDFPMPEEEERRAIWELSFPKEAPVKKVDFDFLAAQFKITGGSIRNASLNAAFLAAEAGTDITMETVILGVKREFQKLGRLRTESDFDRYFDLVNGGVDAATSR